MKGLDSLLGHAHRPWRSACGRFRRSREVPAMSRVDVSTHVTAKRVASGDHLNCDEKWVRRVLAM